MKRSLLILFAGLIITCCAQKKKDYITVFAGVGMKDAVEEVAREYKAKTGQKVKINLACSAVLAQQLKAGAEADVVMFASKKWADFSDSVQTVANESRITLAKTQLVLVAPFTSTLEPFEITPDCNLPEKFEGKMAIGEPSSVPAGKYCMQSLKYYGWTNDLKDRLLPAKDVRAALSLVELGEVEAGVVYASDVFKSDKVKVITTFPEKSHKPIQFISFKTSAHSETTDQFYEFFTSPKAKKIWEKNGFEID